MSIDENVYSDDLYALLGEKISVTDIALNLKNSEDLESDILNYLIEIERIPDWARNRELACLYDLLRMIQQEFIFNKPFLAPCRDNLQAFVIFADLTYWDPRGKAIGQDEARTISLFHRALEIAPGYAYAYSRLGTISLSSGNTKKAYEYYLEAIRCKPDYEFVLAQLGEILRKGAPEVPKDARAAYHYLQRGIAIDPEDPAPHFSLGDLYRTGATNFPRDAKQAYRLLSKAYELDPSDPFVMAGLADLLVRKEDGIPYDPKRSWELFEASYQFEKDNPITLDGLARLLLGNFEGVSQDPQRGLELLEKLQFFDDSVAVKIRLAQALLNYDPILDERRAQELLEEALALEPENPYALTHYGDLLRLGGKGVCEDMKKARALLEKAVSILPDYGYLLSILGEIYFLGVEGEKPDYAKAYACFKKAQISEPNSKFIARHLAALKKLYPSHE